MARGFYSTLGVGTTDRVTTNLSAKSTLRSYHIWANRNGPGGNTFGRFWDGSTPNELCYCDTSIIIYQRKFTTGAQWGSTVASPWAVTGAFHSCGISHDCSGLNSPLFYFDGVSVGVSTAIPPTGTVDSTADALIIGNRGSANRGFDGILQDFAVWDIILTPGEFAALAQGVLPFNIRPANLQGYWPLYGLASPEPDLSGKTGTAALTGTAYRPGAPTSMYSRRRPRWDDTSAAPPPSFIPAWAVDSNLPVLGTGVY